MDRNRNGRNDRNGNSARRRALSRRNFLRAAGVAVALPAMPSLLPRAARAQDDGPIKRFLGVFFPNGSTQRQDWQITGSGSNYTMGTAHDGLIPYQSRFSMFKNLNRAHGNGSPAHARGSAEFLTGAAITNNQTPEVAISIDQAIADQINPPTGIRSLHLGPTPYPSGPPSDTGWPSGYNTYISWRSATQPNAPLESAQTAFDQVYVPGGSDPALAEKRLRMQQSVLDHTIDQIDSINARVGSEDKLRLEEYLDSLREVEMSLQASAPVAGCSDGATDPGSGLDFPTHTQAMLDIIVLALKCDATRIITYSMDYGFGNKQFTFLGAGNGKHHNLSHSGSTQAILDNHKAIVRWYMDQFAYLLEQLDATDDGGVSLLDNSVLYFGSGLGNAWAHDPNNICAMIAGGGSGALNPGRLIDAGGSSYASVLLAMAHAMDAPLASFAGANNPFGGL